MEFKPDFAEIKPYVEAFWQCRVLDRVACSVTAPCGTGPAQWWGEPRFVAEAPPEQILDAFEEYCRATFFGGVAVPCFYPNFGPDVFSVLLGADLRFSSAVGTSWSDWSQVVLTDYDGAMPALQENHPVRLKLRELTRQAVERGRGRYVVGITDLHGGFDALAVLRGGPDRAAMDLIEYPDGVLRALDALFEVWRELYEEYYAAVKDAQEGTSSWIGIWAPGRMFPLQNDFSCLVSPAMYRRFFLGELLREIECLDSSVYHLDGVEALQHLEILLDIPRLNAIQWVCGARYQQEGIARWFPLYRRIQERRKAIVVYPTVQEIPLVLENLKPEGLLIAVACATVSEAQSVLKMLGW